MKGASGTQKTVIVLGAARSGTSITAGILSILGVDLGHVRPVDETNPRGYFEGIGISKLIKEIYDSTDGTDVNPPSHEKIIAQKGKFNTKIKKFVKERSAEGRLWGWKVPGTSLVMDLFLPFLKNPYFIIVSRNPVSVAKSLSTRYKELRKEDVDLLKALKLTNFYNQRMIDFLERHPKLPAIFVSYEEIMSEPIVESERIADFLGLDLEVEHRSKIKKLIIPREKLVFAKRKVALNRLIFVKAPTLVKRFIKKVLSD